jgi:hypothetical protein
MWWDNQFSQVNLNYMPWYPTLGLLDGSDPTFSNGAIICLIKPRT